MADAQRVRFGVLASRQDSQFFVETIKKRMKQEGERTGSGYRADIDFLYGGTPRLDWASKEGCLGQG